MIMTKNHCHMCEIKKNLHPYLYSHSILWKMLREILIHKNMSNFTLIPLSCLPWLLYSCPHILSPVVLLNFMPTNINSMLVVYAFRMNSEYLAWTVCHAAASKRSLLSSSLVSQVFPVLGLSVNYIIHSSKATWMESS